MQSKHPSEGKHVLLTGAGGFLGHHTLEHLLVNTDWRVTVTDSFQHRGIMDRITDVMFAHYSERITRVGLITHDLTVPWSPQMIHRLTKQFGAVDYVFHLASESHVDRSIATPVPFIQNNVNSTLQMLELARIIQPRLFLQISTDEVYGAVPLGRPAKEWDPILPSSPYSASKAAQEAIAISYWRTYGVPVVIVNPMNIIGERQHPEKYVPKAIREILAGDKLSVHVDANGIPSSRVYLHARNVSSALLHIARMSPALYSAGIEFPDRYNVTGDDEVDNLTMAQFIASTIKKTLYYDLADYNTLRPGHDRRYALDGSKLRATGWSPPVPLWDSLARTIKWTLQHREWLECDS